MTSHPVEPTMTKIMITLGLLAALAAGCSTSRKPVQAYQPNLAHGATVYRASCGECHDAGALGAPELKVTEDWDIQSLSRPGVVKLHLKMNYISTAPSTLTDESEADVLAFIRHELGERDKDY